MAKPRGRRAQQTQDRAREREVDSSETARPESDEKTSTSLDAGAELLRINTFFGLVDANDIDYFKQAESTLNINAFDSPQEKSGFIRSVLEESKGKELKLVTNQICSKLFERLILGATERQLKSIFKSFNGYYVALSHHKYASHVLETLLVRAAALTEKEFIDDETLGKQDDEDEDEEDEDNDLSLITMEAIFNQILSELKPHTQEMVDHQYASHTLRLLLLILAGKELPLTTTSQLTLRSKKSKIARKMIEIKDNEEFDRAFQTPPLFKNYLRELINAILADHDTQKLREYASHKIASPVFQLVLLVEGLVDKERNGWGKFFRRDGPVDDKEKSFMEFLLSDPVGSHFLQGIITSGGARLKYIERLFQLYMQDRVLKLARRSTTGVYIIQALLQKLKPRDVESMLDQLIPALSELVFVEDNQNLDLGRTVIDASLARGNYRRDELIEQLLSKFAPSYVAGEANELPEFFENTLLLASSTLGNTRDDWPTADERRRALFLEKLMEYDPVFVKCSWLSIMALPEQRFVQMCLHGVFSHVVEDSLVVPAEESKPELVLRKRLLNRFQGSIVTLSLNAYGLHIVDKLWTFTIFLPMYKDRIASELLGSSKQVKESTYGRLVWKNWGMELFSRRKYDWKATIKQQETEFRGETKKKPIELKMEQLAQQKKDEEEKAQRAEEGYIKRKLEQNLENGKRQKRGRFRN